MKNTEVKAQQYLYDIHSLDNSAKNCVFVVEPRSSHRSDKKL